MIIGFDFDKVFVDYPPLVPYSLIDLLYKGSSYFKKTSENGKMHYRYPGLLEQKIRIITHYPIFRPIIKDNLEVLKKLTKNKKNKTYLISSRFGFLDKRTNSLLGKYNLKEYFEGIYFNFNNDQPHIFKEKTIRKYKIQTYIDDDIHLAVYLASKLPKLKIYWLAGNRTVPKNLPENIQTIRKLKDLEKKIR